MKVFQKHPHREMMKVQNNSVLENLKIIRNNIAEASAKYRKADDNITLMAVTKTVPYEVVNQVINEGVTLLGENRVQEYLEKKDGYDKSATVHFIGHLQTNKVKYIIDSIDCIHSVDSIKLAAEINRLSAKHNKITEVLAEVNIGGEKSKSGISPDALDELIYSISEMKNIRLKGLMTIPPIGESEASFSRMQEIFSDWKNKKVDNVSMDILSMGMSADYVEAIKYGSNIVRLGSALFGARK